MRLISLSANLASFKTVEFNPDGLTLIVGVKTNVDQGKIGKAEKTYNGVGKSLLIELINFCLGSSKNEPFEKSLPGWEFTLRFDMNGVQHTASRNTLTQKKVYLDNVELSLTKYKEFLEDNLFSIPAGIGGLGYRPLISKFIRIGNSSYTKPDETVSDYTAYDALLRNCFLLGLDVDLVVEKYKLRKQQVDIEGLMKSFDKDTVIRDFFRGDLDVNISLTEANEEINRLEEELRRFEVAANYYDIQKEADSLAENLFEIKNNVVLVKNAIDSIDASLRQRPDIAKQKVLAAYKEVTQAFRPETIRHLDEVEQFHQKLLVNRIARLSKDRLKFSQELEDAEIKIKDIQVLLDNKLALLGNSRALDQFVAITNQVSDLKAQAQKLKDFKELKNKYSDMLASVSSSLSTGIIKANAYLSECGPEIENKLAPFRTLAKKFYPKAPAGITLRNNEGDNQIRFDLDVRIQNDASDGINEVRLFCFDMTLLLAKSHQVKFVLHDSRLYSDIDPRQRAILFKTAHEITKSAGLQYIATLNQDQIEGMADQFSDKEYLDIIESNVRVRLKDDSPESKLLGIQVDLHY